MTSTIFLTSYPLILPPPCLDKEEAVIMERTPSLSERPPAMDLDRGWMVKG